MSLDNFRKVWTYKIYPEVSSIPTPPEGFWILWAKSDGFYAKNDNGEEFFMSGYCCQPQLPSSGTANKSRILFGKLGTTGLNSGTTNLNVDGSSTPVIAKIEANSNYDIYITSITLKISDSSVSNSKFGALAELTNGISLTLTESEVSTSLLLNAKTIGQTIGELPNAYKTLLVSYSGNNDLITITSDFSTITNPAGLRIGRGNTDKLELQVNDDLTGLISLEVVVFGYTVV